MPTPLPDIDWPPPSDWTQALEAVGAVRLRGAPMQVDNGALLDLARRLGRVSMRALTRHARLGEPGGVQRVEALEADVADQFGKALQSAGNTRFPLHTDESFHQVPARWVLLHCWRSAEAGGETLLADSRAVLAGADRPSRLALEQFRLPYPCGDRPTFDAEARVRFNPAEVLALLPGIESPQALISRAWLQRFEAAFASAEQRLTLHAGDLLVIDNWRFLHGREAFGGASARLLKRVRVLDSTQA